LKRKITKNDFNKMSAQLDYQVKEGLIDKATRTEIEGIHRVKSLSKSKPKTTPFIRVKLRNYDSESGIRRVKYDLEQYFVPENTGKNLEDCPDGKGYFAEIKVLNGYALLKKVYCK